MQRFLLFFFLPVCFSIAQQGSDIHTLIGSAYTDNTSYSMLQRLCDEAGGRLVGSPANEHALLILGEELKKIGVEPRLEHYTIPGFVRGEDIVRVTVPFERNLRAVALGYVDKTPTFAAEVVFADRGYPMDMDEASVKGKIALVTSERAEGKEEILRYEVIAHAADRGARAVLFINDTPGGNTLAGVSNFQGHPSRIPAYSLSFEEGKWLQRLCGKNVQVKISITTESFCREVSTANPVVTFPGIAKEKIVIGAHFDSWDVGQGAVDNGVGTAILFDVVRLIHSFFPKNQYTIECVWFNGEELGLWGSKRYVEMHTGEPIRAMINMDMTGSPRGFNVMGFDEFIPALETLITNLNGFDLSSSVISSPSTNSDHQAFYLHGIPTITLQAFLDTPMYNHYHDFGDTFDKVNKKYLSEAAAVVSVLIKELANNTAIVSTHRSNEEMIKILKSNKHDERLKKQGEWPY